MKRAAFIGCFLGASALLWLTQDTPQQPAAGDTIIIPRDQRRIKVFHLTIAHSVCKCPPHPPTKTEFPENSYLTYLAVSGAHSSTQ